MSYLTPDSAEHTIALLTATLIPQLGEAAALAGCSPKFLAKYCALQLYAQGYRSSQNILHKLGNPIWLDDDPTPPSSEDGAPRLRLAA